MKIYVVLAKGKRTAPNGTIIFDTKGEWKPVKFDRECNEVLLAYSSKEEAEREVKHQTGVAQWDGSDCVYEVGEFEMPNFG